MRPHVEHGVWDNLIFFANNGESYGQYLNKYSFTHLLVGTYVCMFDFCRNMHMQICLPRYFFHLFVIFFPVNALKKRPYHLRASTLIQITKKDYVGFVIKVLKMSGVVTTLRKNAEITLMMYADCANEAGC